jgi:hypothetical protein
MLIPFCGNGSSARETGYQKMGRGAPWSANGMSFRFGEKSSIGDSEAPE